MKKSTTKKKADILVVEDSNAMGLFLVDKLSEEGYEVEWVNRGHEALHRVFRRPPHLILLDIGLPDIDGYSVCKQIKADNHNQHLPVIFLSTLNKTFDIVRAFKTGAVDYITKPFELEELLVRIRNHLKVDTLMKELAVKNRKLSREVKNRERVEQALRQLSTNLEDQVRDRTADLTKINDELKKEIRNRKKAEKKLLRSLDEKEVLLKEVHHRVKNNMQIISSLLSLQKGDVPEEYQEKHNQSIKRIHSMALVHEMLYQSGDFSGIKLDDYITTITGDLIDSLADPENPVKVDYHLSHLSIDLDQAIPCGLIINELTVNAVKHAFKDSQDNTIHISLKEEDNQTVLAIEDNGKGLPEDFSLEKTTSLGLVLVHSLIDQMNAQLVIHPRNPTRFEIRIPKPAE